jgi:hypothetical protein
MLTALSCLTLEIYYRDLPLYQLEEEDNSAAPKGVDKKRGSDL